MLGPAFACIGLGLLLFPGYRTERPARGENIKALQGHQIITPRWWVILILALCAAVANVYLLIHTSL